MDEILAHISTSTTRENDELYRSFAEAYHRFMPFPPGEVQQARCSDEPESVPGSPSVALLQEGTPLLTTLAVTSMSSRESYGSFPSHVSSEAQLPNQDELYDTQADHMESSIAGTSRLEQLERIQVKWRRQRELSRPRSGDRGTGSNSSTSARLGGVDFMEDTQLAAAVLESQLPYSDSGSEADTSEAESLYADMKKDAIDGRPPRSTLESHEPSFTCNGTNGNSSNERILDVAPSSVPSSPVRATRSTPRSASGQVEHGQSSMEDVDDQGMMEYRHLLTEAFAPFPAITVDVLRSLPSQLTPNLIRLKQQYPEQFKPLRIARTLQADERGYWLMNCGNWPQSRQCEYWISLCDQVHSGSLGWGISLYRNSPSATIGEVRLYCWGEVVEHTWLSLWACSQGRVCGTGSMWLDAGDKVVFEMP